MTQASMSWRLRFSLVTDVEYTLTAMPQLSRDRCHAGAATATPRAPQPGPRGGRTRGARPTRAPAPGTLCPGCHGAAHGTPNPGCTPSAVRARESPGAPGVPRCPEQGHLAGGTSPGCHWSGTHCRMWLRAGGPGGVRLCPRAGAQLLPGAWPRGSRGPALAHKQLTAPPALAGGLICWGRARGP